MKDNNIAESIFNKINYYLDQLKTIINNNSMPLKSKNQENDNKYSKSNTLPQNYNNLNKNYIHNKNNNQYHKSLMDHFTIDDRFDDNKDIQLLNDYDMKSNYSSSNYSSSFSYEEKDNNHLITMLNGPRNYHSKLNTAQFKADTNNSIHNTDQSKKNSNNKVSFNRNNSSNSNRKISHKNNNKVNIDKIKTLEKLSLSNNYHSEKTDDLNKINKNDSKFKQSKTFAILNHKNEINLNQINKNIENFRNIRKIDNSKSIKKRNTLPSFAISRIDNTNINDNMSENSGSFLSVNDTKVEVAREEKNFKFKLKSEKFSEKFLNIYNKSTISRSSQLLNSDKYTMDQFQSLKLFYNLNDRHVNTLNFNVLQISENSLLSQTWNVFILAILLFYILSFPYENYSEKWIKENIYFILINLLLEYSMIIDIFFNFITTYRDEYGHLISNPTDISVNYLRSWFFLDVVASIPSYNLEFFELIPSDYKTQYLRFFKLPRYLRMFRVSASFLTSRFARNFDFDSYILFTNSEINKYTNTIKYTIYLCVISNMLACYLISYTHHCYYVEECHNWFFYLIQEDYNAAYYDYRNPNHLNAIYFPDLADGSGVIGYYNWALDQRIMLYLDAFYFILQTVTTVGYGDISTFNTQDRLFRSFCMIIGALMFTILTSSLIETTLTETLNIYKHKEHEAMVQKLQVKYDIRGESKRYLQLLGDSVYTETLVKEIRFAQLLPKYMSELVLQYIWKIYTKKINLLQEESYDFFIYMMEVSYFRRCIIDETIETETRQLAIVYSGQIGCYIYNLRDYLNLDYLYLLDVGEEIGYNCFIDFPYASGNNYVYVCTVNSELINIPADKFLNLMKYSLKNIRYIKNKIAEYLIELYLMVSLYFSMLKAGVYIDYTWYNRTISFLKLQPYDFTVMETLSQNFLYSIKYRGLDLENGKWYDQLMDYNSFKYISRKIRLLMNEIVEREFVDLIIDINHINYKRSSSNNASYDSFLKK